MKKKERHTRLETAQKDIDVYGFRPELKPFYWICGLWQSI